LFNPPPRPALKLIECVLLGKMMPLSPQIGGFPWMAPSKYPHAPKLSIA